MAAQADTAAEGPLVGSMAADKGKQRLFVLPAERMVVVRFGAIDGGRGFNNAEFLRILVPVASPR
ncbi:MAG: hypothetical protein ACKOYN_08085 [Planctomycetota bacterium]